MPILTHGAETWKWTKSEIASMDISGLMAAEMEFLRSVEGSSKRKKKKKRLWR
jgi:hypothetical protein